MLKLKIIILAYILMGLENGNNRETQPNSPQQNVDYSNEIANHYRNNPEAQQLTRQQDLEKQQLRENLEAPILEETREALDKEAIINEAKTILYEKLGINDKLEDNGSMKKFLKGLVDALVIDNADLAIEVYNTNGKILLDAIKQLASWEGIKGVAKALGESVWNIFAGDAYERGKSVAELGLVATGVGAGIAVGRKGIKFGMKEAVKYARARVKTETLVSTPEVKQVVRGVSDEVEKIVPKQTMNFEKMLVDDVKRLPDSDRVLAGEFYLKRELSPQQQKALLEAHHIGTPDVDGKYSFGDLRTKYETLRKAGFEEGDIRTLMEKGVAGKIDEVPRIDLLKAKQEVDEIIAKKGEVDPKMFERAFEALQQAGVSKEYLQLLKGAGIEDLQVLKRYKFWLEHPRFKEHIEGIMELRNLTPTEAHTIFGYTNGVLRIPKTKTDFINGFVRGELKDLTEEQIKGLQDLVRAFDSGLDKMPNAPEKVLMRGDSAKRRQPGKPIELKGYTSVANNTNDTFVNRKDSLIEITTVPGRAKDISDLAAYKHFAKEMGEPEMATKHEGLILRNSQAVVESIEKDYLVNFRGKDYLKNRIIARQIE